VDFAEIIACQHRDDWARVAQIMAAGAQSVEQGGADFFLLCSNTMHRVADEIAVGIPMLHMIDVVGEAIIAAGIRRVGLLGTCFTMEEDFYKGRLRDRFGLEVLVPGAAGRKVVNDVIFNELISGKVLPASRQAYAGVIARLVDKGAEAVILGCTEIMLLVQESDSPVPLFDTTTLHARAAVDLALGLSQSSRDVATVP
jgi:aspartate racemase